MGNLLTYESQHSNMYKILSFLPKQDGLSPEEFRTMYEEQLVPALLSAAPHPAVYKRHYISRETPILGNKGASSVGFDVITEVGYETKEAMDTAIAMIQGNTEMVALMDKIQYTPGATVYEVDERITSKATPAELAAKGSFFRCHL